jgi:hypothetical protein
MLPDEPRTWHHGSFHGRRSPELPASTPAWFGCGHASTSGQRESPHIRHHDGHNWGGPTEQRGPLYFLIETAYRCASTQLLWAAAACVPSQHTASSDGEQGQHISLEYAGRFCPFPRSVDRRQARDSISSLAFQPCTINSSMCALYQPFIPLGWLAVCQHPKPGRTSRHPAILWSPSLTLEEQEAIPGWHACCAQVFWKGLTIASPVCLVTISEQI